MNEQDRQLLIRYLQYRRKMRIIIFLVIFFIVIASVILLKFNLYKPTDNNVIQENIIDNSENEIVTNNLTNSISTTVDEVIEKKQEKELETITQTETKPVTKDTEKVIETTKPTTSTSSARKEEDKTSKKPANKDFLFIDGYNMDNVTQAAQQYLKSSGYAGECIPLKDNEGVYIGMRVVFY